MDQEARQKEYKDCGLPRQPDALAELARAARDAGLKIGNVPNGEGFFR